MTDYTQRLKSMRDDILQSRETVAGNLSVMESCALYIPLDRRKEFYNTIRASRIELLRLNNVLQHIKNLEIGQFVLVKEKLDEQFAVCSHAE